MTTTIVSYYSPRPDEYGARATAYDEPIAILEASCHRLGLRHVLLTEKGNEDKIPACIDPARVFAVDGTQDLKLMQAIVAGQLAYLRIVGTGAGTIFVGVDCMFMRDPGVIFDGADWDVAVTVGPYSPGGLNNGAVFLAPGRGDKAAEFYALALANCPEEWFGDQQAVTAVCSPLGRPGDITERHDIKVRVLDMDTWNLPPACVDDPGIANAYMLHHKGARKEFMAAAAEQWLGIPRPVKEFVVR